MARTRMDGWTLEFSIDRIDWMRLGATESEEPRARKRARLRRHIGRKAFMEARKEKTIWRVGRFVLLVGVYDPVEQDRTIPDYACETVKPLVDAGTDAKLWADDDADHRVNTTYFAMRDRWGDGRYHLTFIVLPVSGDHDINRQTMNQYRALGAPGFSLKFNIRHNMWLTSNFNDSDLLARQSGNHVYGSKQRFMGGVSPVNRKAARGNLIVTATQRWKDYRNVHMDGDYVTFAGIAYPSDNASDPDNATETISCILGAGLYTGQLPSIMGRCGDVAVYKLAERSAPSYHTVRLDLFRRDEPLASVLSRVAKRDEERSVR